MNLYDTNLNDMELTKLRQQQEYKEGFPVWTVKVLYDDIYIFFTRKGKDEFIELKESEGYKCIAQVKYVTDVKHVSYESI